MFCHHQCTVQFFHKYNTNKASCLGKMLMHLCYSRMHVGSRLAWLYFQVGLAAPLVW